MLVLVELVQGASFQVCALRREGQDVSLVFDYLAQTKRDDEDHWRKLVQRIRRLADRGPFVANQQKSRSLQGTELFELKEQPTRIIWFYDRTSRARIVMTHAFAKRSAKTPPQEIERAEHLQAEYYRQREV